MNWIGDKIKNGNILFNSNFDDSNNFFKVRKTKVRKDRKARKLINKRIIKGQ